MRHDRPMKGNSQQNMDYRNLLPQHDSLNLVKVPTPSGRECYTCTSLSTTSEEVGNTLRRPNLKTRAKYLFGPHFLKKMDP